VERCVPAEYDSTGWNLRTSFRNAIVVALNVLYDWSSRCFFSSSILLWVVTPELLRCNLLWRRGKSVPSWLILQAWCRKRMVHAGRNVWSLVVWNQKQRLTGLNAPWIPIASVFIFIKAFAAVRKQDYTRVFCAMASKRSILISNCEENTRGMNWYLAAACGGLNEISLCESTAGSVWGTAMKRPNDIGR